METNFDNLRFQIETDNDTRTFEWDQYPCDLVGIVVDELDDVWISRGDYTNLIAMSLSPAISTAIRWSTTVTEVLPDGTPQDQPMPVTVKLVDIVADEVLFTETELMFREDNQVGVLTAQERWESMDDVLAAVDKRYPHAAKYNDQFLLMPESDKKCLLAAIIASSDAVKAQLSDIWPDTSELDDD